MSDQTTNLQLPYLRDGQAQKHVTVNESLLKLDALVQLAVLSAQTNVEPASPEDGQTYILPPGKTGANWGGMNDHALAYYCDGAWEQITPREGFSAYVKDRDALYAFDGAAWRWVGGYLGCVVKKSGPQTIPSATHTALSFETEISDTGEFHSTVSNTSRLTVPPGVSRVKVRANAVFAASGVGARSLRILKNGASMEGVPFIRMVNTGASLAAVINVASGVLNVTPGDYFEASVYQDSGGNLNVLADEATWFEIEAAG